MKGLHDTLSKKIPFYAHWHAHPLANTAHWVLFIAFSLAVTASTLTSIQANAQTADDASTTANVSGEVPDTPAVPADNSTDATSTPPDATSSTPVSSSTPDTTPITVSDPASTTATTTPPSMADASTTDATTTVITDSDGGDATSTDIVIASSSGSVVLDNPATTTYATTTVATSTEPAATTTTPEIVKVIPVYTGPVPVPGGSSKSQPALYTLAVSQEGTGRGTFISSPAGISCDSTCSYDFPLETHVTVTAQPLTGATFVSWDGCPTVSGLSCTLILFGNRNISAIFK